MKMGLRFDLTISALPRRELRISVASEKFLNDGDDVGS
jgi:hypothetical protein